MAEILPRGLEKPGLESREPLIVLPDRRIALLYLRHGAILPDGTISPFPDRALAEKEVAAVFPDGIDGLLTDSFPGIPALTKDVVTHALAEDEGTVNFHDWAVRYAVTNGATIVAGDPIARSDTLSSFILAEDSVYIQEIRERDRAYTEKVKYLMEDPTYQSLESLLRAAMGAELGLEFLLGLQLMSLAGKGLDLSRGARLSRRELLVSAGLGAVTTATALLRQEVVALENFLAGQQEERRNSLGPSPSSQMWDDIQRVLALFQEGKELTAGDFEEPSFQRKALLNSSKIISLGFRNALIAETLTLPGSDILPWTTPRPYLRIPVVLGLDHAVVPESMRVSSFIRNERERVRYIQIVTGASDSERPLEEQNSFLRDLRRELRRGVSYRIFPDGSFRESSFLLPSLA